MFFNAADILKALNIGGFGLHFYSKTCVPKRQKVGTAFSITCAFPYSSHCWSLSMCRIWPYRTCVLQGIAVSEGVVVVVRIALDLGNAMSAVSFGNLFCKAILGTRSFAAV